MQLIFFWMPLLFLLGLYITVEVLSAVYPAYAAMVWPVTWVTTAIIFWSAIVRRKK